MKNVLVSIFLFCALNVAAQEQNVAVYVTGPQPGINKILGDQFVKSFAQSGDYKAIERTTSFLAELNKEQSYQEGGAVDNNQITRLGKQFGAQLVCVVEALDAFGQYYVSARLIAVETAEVLNSSNAYSKLDNLQEVITVASSMAEELTGIAELKEQELAKLKKAVEAGYMQIGDVYYLVTPLKQEFTQSEAYEYASTFTYGGLKGWRLPTCEEALMINNEVKKYHAIYPDFPDLETREGTKYEGAKVKEGGFVMGTVSTFVRSNCTSSQGNSAKTSQSNQDIPKDTPPRIYYQHYWCAEKSFYLHEGKIHDRGEYSRHIFLVRDTSTAIADELALKYELEQQKRDSVDALKSSLRKALEIGYVQIGDIYLLNQIFDSDDYRGAVRYANKLTFGGLKGWRLPTCEEAMMVANKLNEFAGMNVSGFINLCPYEIELYRNTYWCSETFFYLNANSRKIVDCERGERFHFFLVRDVE